MSAATQKSEADNRPRLDVLRWAALRYTDGELGIALDMAKARLSREARSEGRVVHEWVKSPSMHVRLDSVPSGATAQDGEPVMMKRRTCVLYLVAVCRSAPPEKWVRLTTSIGPAAVEVATVEKGKVLKVDVYHPEDMRHVAMGYAQRALEGVE